MARDWRWRKASFKGAFFYVDASAFEESRRIARHEYADSEDYDLEDLGLGVGTIQVTAYFVSETADTDAKALRTALNAKTPGTLTLPVWGALQVRAERWQPNWQQQRLNYVGFPITFLLEASNYRNASGAAASTPPLGLGEREMASMLADLPATLSGALASKFATAPDLPFDVSDSIEAANDIGAMVDVVRAGTPGLPDPVSVQASLAVTNALDGNETGSDVASAAASIFTTLDTVLGAITTGNPAASILLGGVGAAVSSHGDLAGSAPPGAVAPLVWASAAVMFGAEAAVQAATQAFTDRQAAIDARAQVASIAGDVGSTYDDLGPEATAAFDALIARAALHISSQIANLAPVIVVEMLRSMPAGILAHRLYGDPERGDELVARNKVATPSFMPLRFEAAMQ